MTLRALVLDIGGVLVRTEDWTPRQRWEQRLGLAPNTLEPLVHGGASTDTYERGGLSFDAFWAGIGERLGIAPQEIAQFRDDFYSGDRLNRQLMTFVRAVRKRGLKTGIISNAPPTMRLMITHTFPIIRHFDAVILSGEAGVRKPEARIYGLACEALAVRAAEAVFLDDLVVNIEGARAAGMLGVHFSDTARAIAAVEALAGAGSA